MNILRNALIKNRILQKEMRDESRLICSLIDLLEARKPDLIQAIRNIRWQHENNRDDKRSRTLVLVVEQAELSDLRSTVEDSLNMRFELVVVPGRQFTSILDKRKAIKEPDREYWLATVASETNLFLRIQAMQ